MPVSVGEISTGDSSSALASAGPYERFQEKKLKLQEQMKSMGAAPRLKKSTSNLFRLREKAPSGRLDVRAFNQVLSVNGDGGTIDVEGMTPYDALCEETFRHGCLPAVVPQLKSITIGGAVAGLGIEASSFRYGLVHETVSELEVLLASGDTVVCTPDNSHSDLFFAFPNSYGTLGYALRVKTKAIPAKPFVKLHHLQFDNPKDYFRALEKHCALDSANSFVDGVIFSENLYVLTLGSFVEDCGTPSDYTFRNIYYRSLLARDSDCLAALDYIWRWDTDWFWCSRVLGAQNPIIRRLLGRSRLNSRFYKKIVELNDKLGLRRRLRAFGGTAQETIIQDVDVPIGKAVDFAEFYLREIGLLPVWICPFRSLIRGRQFSLFPIDTAALYVNFGFWDAKTTKDKFPEGHFNRLIEQELIKLGGTKSLYSDSFFTREEFAQLYNGDIYESIKRKYDPDNRLPDLYSKCVLGR